MCSFNMEIPSDNMFKLLRKLFSASEMAADKLKMKKGREKR